MAYSENWPGAPISRAQGWGSADGVRAAATAEGRAAAGGGEGAGAGRRAHPKARPAAAARPAAHAHAAGSVTHRTATIDPMPALIVGTSGRDYPPLSALQAAVR